MTGNPKYNNLSILLTAIELELKEKNFYVRCHVKKALYGYVQSIINYVKIGNQRVTEKFLHLQTLYNLYKPETDSSQNYKNLKIIFLTRIITGMWFFLQNDIYNGDANNKIGLRLWWRKKK